MRVIPAIDLKNGRCVRLVEGREQSAKVYDRDPIEVAAQYRQSGAELIHVVDLDGAFLGVASENQKIIRRIAEEVAVPLEVGGGVRSLDEVENLLDRVGARYVIIGTAAAEQPDIVRKAVERFGDSIIVGIDARGTSVAIRGWTETTTVDSFDLAGRMAAAGVHRIVYTDISRDGRLEGPNFDLTGRMAQAARVPVTASGGVSSLRDIARLRELEPVGVDSVIVGKALYEWRFSLEEAIDVASRPIKNGGV